VTITAPLLSDPCCPGGANVHLDRTGVPFLVCPYHPEAREALERFYLDFEPKRAAQGLPPASAERIARWLDSVLPRGIHLLACRDQQLIGHALLIPTEKEGGAEYAIFLHQDVRGRGLGTELNRIAIETARAAGLRRVWLCVAPHNRAAIKSYERVGFRFLPGTIYSPEAEMQIDLV
jgi:RimJ/RimL family protein N-acetyltransferase